VLRHLPSGDPVHIDSSHRELPARGAKAEELTAMNAGMAPSHHHDVTLGDDVVDCPVGIKRLEQVGDPLLESAKARSLLGKGGMVQVVRRDDPAYGRKAPRGREA
jgi:hypothetical protein